MGKILLAVTTYNQLDYTKKFYESFRKLDNENIDLIIIDDASTDGTPLWCFDHDIKCHFKDEPKGLTHSWNVAYKIFKTRDVGLAGHKAYIYDYLIIANNDIIIPKGAIEELIEVAENWPFSVIVPMSTIYGSGHNKIQRVSNYFPEAEELFGQPEDYQAVQDGIIELKNHFKNQNNLFQFDPIRMKLFNGFFFLMTRKVINYENENGNIFDETKPLYKAEDEFNWAKLIPNNDFPALCKTSFIYHFKGQSTKGFSTNDNTLDKIKQKRNKMEE